VSPPPVYFPTAWTLPKLIKTRKGCLRNPVGDLLFWDGPDSCVALGTTRNRDIDFKHEVKPLRQASELFSFCCALNQKGVHSLHRSLLIEFEVTGQQKTALSFCDLNQLLIVKGAGIFDVLAKHAKPSCELPEHAICYELQISTTEYSCRSELILFFSLFLTVLFL